MKIQLHGWAHGGEAVGRLPDGRACFVAGGIPGELVSVRLTQDRRRWARAELVDVVEASADRVSPPCPHAARCGGCQLQHVSPDEQLRMKSRVLTDQLRRIGGQEDLADVEILVPEEWPAGYRLRARVAVAEDGRVGFRRSRSHEVEPVDVCMLLTPSAQALLDRSRGTVAGPAELSLLAGDDGSLVSIDDQMGQGAVHVAVGEHTFRVSGGSFFQSSRSGARLLAETVRDAAQVGPGDRVMDLYCGVGLLTVFLASAGATVTAVEGSDASIADCAHNCADLPVEVIHGDVGTVVGRLDRHDVVVLDPPRKGAGPDLCRALTSLGPRRIVYVACDPAALARDTATLTGLGYGLRSVVGLDLFGYTAHVEAVAVFDHGGSG